MCPWPCRHVPPLTVTVSTSVTISPTPPTPCSCQWNRVDLSKISSYVEARRETAILTLSSFATHCTVALSVKLTRLSVGGTQCSTLWEVRRKTPSSSSPLNCNWHFLLLFPNLAPPAGIHMVLQRSFGLWSNDDPRISLKVPVVFFPDGLILKTGWKAEIAGGGVCEGLMCQWCIKVSHATIGLMDRNTGITQGQQALLLPALLTLQSVEGRPHKIHIMRSCLKIWSIERHCMYQFCFASFSSQAHSRLVDLSRTYIYVIYGLWIFERGYWSLLAHMMGCK